MTDRRVDAPLPASLSDAVPSEGYALTPLVGLYASFETLASLEALVAGLPERSGLAFAILMQSTQDGLVSALEAALARATSMPVLHFIEGARLVSDTVHLLAFDAPLPAPPGNGQPRPTPLHSLPPHAAFDLFLRAFAETHGAHFATVRFADAGAEGVVGLARLRERGGLVVAQDRGEPGSGGEHADRRRASFEGPVDVTLPLAQTGTFLARYFLLERRLRVHPSYRADAPEYLDPAEDGADFDRLADNPVFREVLGLLRSRTGGNFESYRHVTLLRRIARRMQVLGAEDLRDYLQVLSQQPDEAGALLQDLLVSATQFFRDIDVFEALGAHLPGLFARKGTQDAVRVWIAACATGEEAYSVAMLLQEHASTLPSPPRLGLVAHDLNSHALAVARAGSYAGLLEMDVSPERLARFFTREATGHRVRREIRDLVVFMAHDLMDDPRLPSHDLVMCRNLLVYLGTPARTRVLHHIAQVLRPGGLLVLGPQDPMPDHHPEFLVVDRRHRIYARRSRGTDTGPSTAATWMPPRERRLTS